MTRLLLGAAIGFTVGVVGAAALGLHAQDLDGVPIGTVEAANEANVRVDHLLGWMASEPGVPARTLLQMSGELSAPVSEPVQAGGVGASLPSTSSVSAATERLLDCLAWAESRNTPTARNPRSGASGLLQFLPSTWATTPQGKAGRSIWDPSAQRQAGAWMISVGRLREWSTWRLCA